MHPQSSRRVRSAPPRTRSPMAMKRSAPGGRTAPKHTHLSNPHSGMRWIRNGGPLSTGDL
eukprot:2729953-Alexandrium_andersonii.AAC.1